MARTGRPPIKISKREFEELCKIQCTEEEICAVLGCSDQTLNEWCKKTYQNDKGKPMTFLEVFRQKREGGKPSLRRKQWKLADTSAAMAIFLGKNYLGQKDQPDEFIDQEDSDAYFKSGELDEDRND